MQACTIGGKVNREIIRVEPLSTYLENWKAPTSAVTRAGDTIYVSGLPPFDPDTGEVSDASVERKTEIVLEQLKLCLETAGSSLGKVLKCTVYCTPVEKSTAATTPPPRPPRPSSTCPPGMACPTSKTTASPPSSHQPPKGNRCSPCS